MHARSVRFIMLTVLALVVAACGGGNGAGDASSEPTTVTTVAESNDSNGAMTEDEAEQSAEDLAESAAEALEGQQQSFGGGSARLVVGDQSWEFARVLCAFGEEQIGAEGAEFVLSSLQDGLQLYVLADKTSKHLNDPCHHFVYVKDSQLKHLTTSKREQTSSE